MLLQFFQAVSALRYIKVLCVTGNTATEAANETQCLYSIPSCNIQRQTLKPQYFKDGYLAPPLKITFSSILHKPILCFIHC